MTIAPPIHHVYDTADQPLITPDHHAIVGQSSFRCIQEDCDGLHHWWCSCPAR